MTRVLLVTNDLSRPIGSTHTVLGLLNAIIKTQATKYFTFYIFEIQHDFFLRKTTPLFMQLLNDKNIYWLSNIPPFTYRGLYNSLMDVALKIRPDVIFSITVLDPCLPKIAKKTKSRLIFYNIDDPMLFTTTARLILYRIAKQCNLIATQSRGSISIYKKIGVKNAIWLPLAFDDMLLKLIPKKSKPQYDIVFIGNFIDDRIEGLGRFIYPLIKAGLPVKIFGANYPRGFPCEGPLPFTKLPEVISLTKVNLNIHRNLARRVDLSVNLRVFEVLGLGGFLLTDHFRGIEDLFVVGEELESGKNGKEFIQKAKYYLEAEEERREIAKKGQKKVLNKHTWVNRWKVLREAIESLLRA